MTGQVSREVSADNLTTVRRGVTLSAMMRTATRPRCPFLAAALAAAFAAGPANAAVIDWSSFLGGSAEDIGYDIALSDSGDVYVVGHSVSLNFPATGGFHTDAGGQDAFVTRVDPSGTSVVWSSYLGGANTDQAQAVAVDASGNAYVTGNTNSTDFPAVGAFDSTVAGVDAFVVRVAAAGSSLDWASLLGGAGSDRGSGIALSGAGDVVVVGQTASSDFPSTGGFDTMIGGSLDAFVTLVANSGPSVTWSTYVGGTGDDWANDVDVDALGEFWVAGATQSSDFVVVGGFDTALDGAADAFLARVDEAGPTLGWSTYLGGSDADYGIGVALDGAGDVLFVGNTLSSDFPAPGGFDTTANGLFDAFVGKLATAGGSLAWASYFGGSADDYGLGVADANGDILIAGATFSSNLPVSGAFDSALGGTEDGYVARVDDAGSVLRWASYVGESGDELAWAAAADDTGRLVATGQTSSSTFPVPGGFDTSYNGGVDAFAMRIVDCGDGTCTPPETECDCPADCTGDPGTCGDGCCLGIEDHCNCAADCPDVCSDGCCGPAETECTCPADCGADTCGNGCCGAAETPCSCAADCPDGCGDNCCGITEDPCDCAADCGADTCGNSCCGAAETACSCPGDCMASCGDCCCSAGENATTCPGDCGAVCGDGTCGSCESAIACPDDCACDGGRCEGSEPTADADTDSGSATPDSGTPASRAASDGCGCRVGSDPGRASSLALLLAALFARARRRRGVGGR